MADEVFSSYDKLRAEREVITKEIDGEVFTFPGACPSGLALDFIATAKSVEVPAQQVALLYFGELISKEDLDRLCSVTTFPELVALVTDIFTHYHLIDDPPPPNRKARRASSKRSSQGSARSQQTSAVTTA